MGWGGIGCGRVGWGRWDNRCYSYLSQMHSDANCCDMSLYKVLFLVGWGGSWNPQGWMGWGGVGHHASYYRPLSVDGSRCYGCFIKIFIVFPTLIVSYWRFSGIKVGNVLMFLFNSFLQLIIYGIVMFVVCITSVVTIYMIYNMTSKIQKFALDVVRKTEALEEEKLLTDKLLYQMMPRYWKLR